MLIYLTSLSIQFLAFTAGAALLIWALRKGGDGSVVATFVGLIVTILSFMFIIGTFVLGIQGVIAGNFRMDKNASALELQRLQQMEDMIGQLKSELKTKSE